MNKQVARKFVTVVFTLILLITVPALGQAKTMTAEQVKKQYQYVDKTFCQYDKSSTVTKIIKSVFTKKVSVKDLACAWVKLTNWRNGW